MRMWKETESKESIIYVTEYVAASISRMYTSSKFLSGASELPIRAPLATAGSVCVCASCRVPEAGEKGVEVGVPTHSSERYILRREKVRSYNYIPCYREFIMKWWFLLLDQKKKGKK